MAGHPFPGLSSPKLSSLLCLLLLPLQCGLASGTMEPAAEGGQWAGEQQSAGGSGAGSAGEGPFTPWPPRWRMRWHRQQRGIVRFNCADSLDRTNAATCFAMLPVRGCSSVVSGGVQACMFR